MALSAVDQSEFSWRLTVLLRRSRTTAKALSELLGKPTGYISWLMNSAAHVPTEMVVPIAEALAGRKPILDDAVEVGKYLIGLRADPPLESTAPENGGSPIPGWRNGLVDSVAA